jgi:hypothetical protein
MQIDPNKNSTVEADSGFQKPASIGTSGFRFPKWAGIAVFIIFGGYAGIKQYISDLPRAAPTNIITSQKSEESVRSQVPTPALVAQDPAADSSVEQYAKQLADRNRVQISGKPRYNLEHPMQLVLYPTSDGKAIICSLKRVECFSNQKMPNS